MITKGCLEKIDALNPIDKNVVRDMFRAMEAEGGEHDKTLVVSFYDEDDIVEGQYVAELHFVLRKC